MKLIFITVKLNSISQILVRTGDRFPQRRQAQDRAPSATDTKTIPKKCQSSIAIPIAGNFFWLMRKFQAIGLIIRQMIEKTTD
ncbi:hypothetical protein AGROH133_08791 [Agrobacterium tumefaciens]|nr:hypothetical protein AGROH133_08791 [Agrobacterium tumefaciens]